MGDMQTRIQRLQLDLVERDATIRHLTAQLQSAVEAAGRLEQENARLVETLRGDDQ